jgi:LysM repeat protein
MVASTEAETFIESETEKIPALRIHIVKKGDTLRTIAREYLGNSQKVEKIRKINGLRSDTLRVGSELIIPDR